MGNLVVSKYNFFFVTSRGDNLLYNSRTNSFLNLGDDLFDWLQRKNNVLMDDLVSQEVLDILTKHKVLVTNDEDESFYLSKKMEYNAMSYASQELLLTIAPTLDCNFCCGYCFEKHKKREYMSDEKIDELIEFIKSYKNESLLHLTWFGGEPLLALKPIKKILSRIKTETNLKMGGHSIITNGFCFNQDAIDIFKEFPLDKIQITIDGCKEHHDRIRKLKDGNPTFDVIINNIRSILEQLPDTFVSIRVNINQYNKDDFTWVWRYFQDNFSDYRRRLTIYPGIIKVLDKNNKCWTCETLLAKDRSDFFYDINQNAGIPVRFYPHLQRKGCIATTFNGFVIGPEGEIYKCWNEVGCNDKIVGHIDRMAELSAAMYSKYMVSGSCFEVQECEDCMLLPICSGGCPKERISNLYEKTSFELCSIYKDPKILAESLEKHYFFLCNKTKKNE